MDNSDEGVVTRDVAAAAQNRELAAAAASTTRLVRGDAVTHLTYYALARAPNDALVLLPADALKKTSRATTNNNPFDEPRAPPAIATNPFDEQPPPAAPSPAAAEKRRLAALELRETESRYAESLQLVERTLMGPLLALGILEQRQIARIFSNVAMLAELAASLAARLEERLAGWRDETCVGDIVCAHASSITSAYVQFVANFEQSSRALKAAEEKPEFQEYVRHWKILLAATGAGHHTIGDLLIRPVQRVPRYQLLLSELIKRTPSDHPDAARLAEALALVERIASAINEAVRRREASETLATLQRRLGGAFEMVKPGRSLLRQGTLLVHAGPHEKPRASFVVLLNDALVVAEPSSLSSDKLVFRKAVYPVGASIARGSPCSVAVACEPAGHSLTLVCETDAEAELWRVDLSRADSRAPSASPATTTPARAAAISTGHVLGKAPDKSAGAGRMLSGVPQRSSGLLAGWLLKKGGGGADGDKRNFSKGGRRNWKRRFIVVTSSQFVVWYASERSWGHAEPKGHISLLGAQVSRTKKSNGLVILNNIRSLELIADDEQTVARWISVLQDAANAVPDTVAPPPPPAPPAAPGHARHSSDDAEATDALSKNACATLRVVEDDGTALLEVVRKATGAPTFFKQLTPAELQREKCLFAYWCGGSPTPSTRRIAESGSNLASHTVCFADFCKNFAWRARQLRIPHDEAAARLDFARYDHDADGVVSLAEYVAKRALNGEVRTADDGALPFDVSLPRASASGPLGIDVEDLPGSGGGVRVSLVKPEGLAAAPGLIARGDVLLAINGAAVHTVADAMSLLRQSPSNVELRLLPSFAHDAPAGPAAGARVLVLYEYAAREDGELSILAGEQLEILSADTEWWCGRNATGEEGFFPSNFVCIDRSES